MAEQDLYRKHLQDIMSATMPNINKQRDAMYNYLVQQGQRQGIGSAMQQAGKAVAPYAQAAGDAAAKGGIEASRMAQQTEQFNKQQENWEKTFAAAEKQRQMSNALAQYQATGVLTPELMKMFGLSDLDKADIRNRDKQLEMLGLTASGEKQPWASGPFGSQNRMLYERAMMPGSQFSTRTQRAQQAWLANQFGG
jgi:hypothetical protein